MSEEKETWQNYLALATVILAVAATLSTFKGSSYSTRSVMLQSQASDQWAYFQAKSVKNHLYEIQKDKLEMELVGHGLPASSVAAYKKNIAEYTQKTETLTAEKEAIYKDAKRLEIERDKATLHAQAFAMAVIFLQISVLISSIAGLLKQKQVWYVGLALGSVGMVAFANGFLLFF